MGKKTSASSLTKVIGIVVLNLFPSLIIPFLLDFFNVLTPSEAILLGLSIWILLNSSVIMYTTNKLGLGEEEQQALADIKTEFDLKLVNIQRNFQVLLANRRDTPDLFQSTFDLRLSELDSALFETATKDELHIKSGHLVSTDFLMRSFQGETEDIFRPVHLLEDNGWFFDIIARGYFYQAYQLVQDRKIREVRRLMLYKNDTELQDANSIKLMRFHATNPNYDYKIMPLAAFQALLRDSQPLSVPRDFGIYGNKYIYIAETNQMDNLIGYYRRSPAAIEKYITFFDKCWGHVSAKKHTFTKEELAKPMTLDDLFG